MLQKENYHIVLQLMKSKNIHNAPFFYVNSKKADYVIVDNESNPKVAAIITSNKIFFFGVSSDVEFIKNLATFLFERSKKEFYEKKILRFDGYYYEQSWEERVEKLFTEPKYENRCYYELTELKDKEWQEKIPTGFKIEQITADLFDDPSTLGKEWLLEEIESMWNNTQEFFDLGGGFCVLNKEREIIAWCTLEYPGEESIECGVATKEEYRQRGFAFLVSCATCSYALEKYKKVGWHCIKENIGSAKTAEKIGFLKKEEYQVAIKWLNQVDNLINEATTRYFEKEYVKAIDFYLKIEEKMFISSEEWVESFFVINKFFSIERLYYRLSSSYAGIGLKEDAFKYLEKAINNNYNNEEELQKDKNFEFMKKEITPLLDLMEEEET